jgi:hypothetical protein
MMKKIGDPVATIATADCGAKTARTPKNFMRGRKPGWMAYLTLTGRLIWPFAEETNTLLSDDTLNTFTPILSITSALGFVLAAAALLRWRVPSQWFPWFIAAGAALSIVLQVIWFTGWSLLPLLVDIALLWAVFRMSVTVDGLRVQMTGN